MIITPLSIDPPGRPVWYEPARWNPEWPALPPEKRPFLARLLAAVREFRRRHRSRRGLVRLDPHLLKDIGLSHGEAEFEASKPFWRG